MDGNLNQGHKGADVDPDSDLGRAFSASASAFALQAATSSTRSATDIQSAGAAFGKSRIQFSDPNQLINLLPTGDTTLGILINVDLAYSIAGPGAEGGVRLDASFSAGTANAVSNGFRGVAELQGALNNPSEFFDYLIFDGRGTSAAFTQSLLLNIDPFASNPFDALRLAIEVAGTVSVNTGSSAGPDVLLSASLSLGMDCGSALRDAGVDYVCLPTATATASVPEPMSLALFSLGLSALGFSRARRLPA